MAERLSHFEGGSMKKKHKKGLDVLFSRGQSTFQPDKKKEAEAKHFAEVRKKKAYAKLLEKEAPSKLEIPDALPDRPFAAEDDSDCDLSDEEVSDSDIVFKDPEIQTLWSGSAAAIPSRNAKQGGLEKPKPATGGKPFEVPSWDNEMEVEVPAKGSHPSAGATGSGNKRHDKKPSPAASGDKSKPNPFKAAEKKASEAQERLKEEQEREREERERAQAARAEYFRGRKRERSEHLRRTSRGQPIMKNVIQGFLSKLEKDAGK